MKNSFINKYLCTRKLLEVVCRLNGLNEKGSREELVSRIKTLSYSTIKQSAHKAYEI